MFQPKLTDCCSDAVSCGILGTDLHAAHSYTGSCSEVPSKQTDLEGDAVEFFVGVLIEQSTGAELPLMDLLVSQSRASQAVRELVGEYAESGFVRFLGRHPDVFAFENDTVSLRMKKSEEKPCATRHKFVVPKSPPSASHVTSKDLAGGVVVQRTKSPFQDISNRMAPQAKSGLVLKFADFTESAKVDSRSQCKTGTEQFKICEEKEAVSRVIRSALPGTRRPVREARHIPSVTRPLCPEFSSEPQANFVPLIKTEGVAQKKAAVKRYSAEELYAIRDAWLRTNPPALALPPLDDEMTVRYWTEACDSFERMNLKEELLRGIYVHGLTKPNLVHQLATMPCCSGEDVVLIRPREAAFCGYVSITVAVLGRIDATHPSCQAVILVPNAAVAARITETVCSLGRYLNVSCVDLDFQSSKGGCNASELIIGHVIVGTPNRLLELFDRMLLNVFAIKMLVLENSEEMFVYECFLKTQLHGVFHALPSNIQVLLSCSHLIPELLLLTSEFMKFPIRVVVDPIAWRRDHWQANRQPRRNSRDVRRSQSDGIGAPPRASASSSSAAFAGGSCQKRDERRAVDFFQATLASGFPEQGAEVGRLFGRSTEAAWAVRRVTGNDIPAFARFLAAHPDEFILDGETVRLPAAVKPERKVESAEFTLSQAVTTERNNGVFLPTGESSLTDDVAVDNEFACLDDIDVKTFVCDDKALPPWLRGMTVTVMKESPSPLPGLSPVLPSSPKKCKAKVASKIAQSK